MGHKSSTMASFRMRLPDIITVEDIHLIIAQVNAQDQEDTLLAPAIRFAYETSQNFVTKHSNFIQKIREAKSDRNKLDQIINYKERIGFDHLEEFNHDEFEVLKAWIEVHKELTQRQNQRTPYREIKPKAIEYYEHLLHERILVVFGVIYRIIHPM